ncbi:300 kDa antigen AG231-like isoform X1 [Homarus americanus]|uniref:300 kDa antigen AG231-like isoform X1 n=1 Tax=Homarus americanus TaxID=6706 RepID=UPI001C45FBF5|nr:300 kDa antigen AG231-like isoform X1 [Homarus americanus]
MAKAIKKDGGASYAVGSPGELLYPASGGSDDWVAGIGKVPFVYTIELRDKGAAGFILPKELIKPTVRDAWSAIKRLHKHITNAKSGPRTAVVQGAVEAVTVSPPEADTAQEPAFVLETDTTKVPVSPPEADTTKEPVFALEEDTTKESVSPPEADTTKVPVSPPEADTTKVPVSPPEADTTKESVLPPEADTTQEPAFALETDTTKESVSPPETDTTKESVSPPEADTTKVPVSPPEADTTQEPAFVLDTDTTKEPVAPHEADTTKEPVAPHEADTTKEPVFPVETNIPKETETTVLVILPETDGTDQTIVKTDGETTQTDTPSEPLAEEAVIRIHVEEDGAAHPQPDQVHICIQTKQTDTDLPHSPVQTDDIATNKQTQDSKSIIIIQVDDPPVEGVVDPEAEKIHIRIQTKKQETSVAREDNPVEINFRIRNQQPVEGVGGDVGVVRGERRGVVDNSSSVEDSSEYHHQSMEGSAEESGESSEH